MRTLQGRADDISPHGTVQAVPNNSGPITEVACELIARSCDTPHPYTKNAPTAQKFSDQRCKRSFATVSVTSRADEAEKWARIIKFVNIKQE